MFPSTKPCLCKETNDSCSNAVIGILIVTLAITVGLSVLGVWAYAENGSQNDDFDLPFIPEKIPLKDLVSEQSSGGKSNEISDEAAVEVCDVSVPECDCVGRYDTLPGTLEIIDQNLPSGPLPLCIDNAYLEPFYVTVESIGGYSPKWGAVFLNQMKGDDCFEGVINADWTETAVDGCPCAVDYKFTFSVCEPICLDSNHLPKGMDQSVYLDKWVDVSYCTKWEGCHLDTQEFMVILAHKAMSQKTLTPDE
jgi:hypothetical protein